VSRMILHIFSLYPTIVTGARYEHPVHLEASSSST
jgi:hypothetical protein